MRAGRPETRGNVKDRVIEPDMRQWPEDGDNLLSRCWCDTRFVRVPMDLVRRSLTFPCELDVCVNMAREHGWTGPRTGRRRHAKQRAHGPSPEQMRKFYDGE